MAVLPALLSGKEEKERTCAQGRNKCTYVDCVEPKEGILNCLVSHFTNAETKIQRLVFRKGLWALRAGEITCCPTPEPGLVSRGDRAPSDPRQPVTWEDEEGNL